MLQTGARLGPYTVLAPLGAGGMGEVYRARDTRLGRQVAVKILPEAVANDPRRVARFETEARALAALSHPNILEIHDFGQSDGRLYAVTELLDGETLRERMGNDPMTWRKAVEIAAAIADGLASAHGRGIVHRDLKPENVFVTGDGRVKILDFGLAKVTEPVSGEAVTLTTPVAITASADGQVVGTLSYMAPEQLRGRRVDGRADIFALGCVLFEMLSGKRPFPGGTPADAIVSILHGEPLPLDACVASVPAALVRIVHRCLEKRAEDRFDTAHDLALALRSVSSDDGAGEPRPSPWSSRKRRLSILAMATALLAAGGALLTTSSRFAPATDPGATAAIPRQITANPGWDTDPALSPDETLVAYVSNAGGRADIWLVDVQGGEPMRLTDDPEEKSKPTWFPDGRSIAYVSNRGEKPSIWKVSRLGGSPTLLLNDADMPAISPDGRRIAFVRPGGAASTLRIWEAPLDDLAHPSMLTTDEGGLWEHSNPAWSPDGTRICYADWSNLWVLDVAARTSRPLTTENAYDGEPAWSRDGSFVYFASLRGRVAAVWRVRSGGGKPVRQTSGPGPERHPSISRDGRLLVYSTYSRDPDILVLDRTQGTTSRFGSARREEMPALAPDASSVAYVSDRLGKPDLFLQPLAGGRPVSGAPRRLTDLATSPATPAFAKDGRWIAYFQAAGGRRDIWLVPASGGAPVRVTSDSGQNVHPSFSPDDSLLVFVSSRSGLEHVWIQPMRGGVPDGDAWQLTSGNAQEMFPAFSPRGDVIAFVRRGDIWLIAPHPGADGRRVTTTEDVHTFAWEPGGRSLLASGTWGSGELRIRRVQADTGAVDALTPDLVLGDRASSGYLGLSRDGRYLAIDITETKGNLWAVGSSAVRP